VLIQRAGSASHLRKLADELGVGARLRFLPAVTGSELVTLLQGARALLQPSVIEGFGIPALEAMACGCPVVASDTPALLEVMGGAGLHAPVGDHHAMARALTRLRANGMRSDLREQGLARASSFSWERTAQATLAVYREAAAEGAKGRVKSA
jgi:glycosyltransferase involved in cell wall biosynthesis